MPEIKLQYLMLEYWEDGVCQLRVIRQAKDGMERFQFVVQPDTFTALTFQVISYWALSRPEDFN